MAPVPVPVGSRRVDPDPSITSAIGRNHSFSTAVADLVDNSVDAGASNILIRFMIESGIPVGLRVIDDGAGMDTSAIDHAMTYARKRDYDDTDLGHFGIGLKSASLSQADRLIVWSRRFGAPPVGRRILRSTIDAGPLVESYTSEDARDQLHKVDVEFELGTGTIVEWQEVRSFLHSNDPREQTAWLEQKTEDLRSHLGLVLHRILSDGQVTITVEQYDVEVGPGAPRTVVPLDPFGSLGSGGPGFPATLQASIPEGTVHVTAHLWPPSEDGSTAYILDGRGPLDSQGLYVYRRDRLLQVGGWNTLARRERDLQYLRLSLDITAEIDHRIAINPEKTGVVLDSTLKDALLMSATCDGHSFRDILASAREGAIRARQRRARPVTVVEPQDGLPVDILDAFADAVEFDTDEQGVDIRWRQLPLDEFFRVDSEERVLWLNLRYRTAVVGRRSLRPDDAPLVKSLIHLLLHEHFAGSIKGAREKRREAAWQQILVAAVRWQEKTSEGAQR